MSALPGEPPKKRGRPKRVTENYVPHLTRTDTAPIKVESGPSIGTFNNSRNNSILKSLQHPTQQLLSRQDTDQDALQLMVTSLNVQNEDLEIARSDDEGRRGVLEQPQLSTTILL